MNTREELLNHLKNVSDVLRTEELERAFADIDRADFVLGDYESEAYEDYALPILEGRNMLKPTVVAFMLELLDPQVGDRVMDVVSGTGFVSALIAYMVGEEGEVLGLERSPELLRFSREKLKKYNFPHLRLFEPTRVDLEEDAFDKIIITEDLDTIPERFIRALREEGLMVTPLDGEIKLFRKHQNDLLEERSVEGFSFDPFVDIEE